ncbi:hypothetical protein J6590_055545 [Homalodisca vitripennis]|nr:hypothetical protein J6590_055545 [Homalodisca vitripennis]
MVGSSVDFVGVAERTVYRVPLTVEGNRKSLTTTPSGRRRCVYRHVIGNVADKKLSGVKSRLWSGAARRHPSGGVSAAQIPVNIDQLIAD